MIKTNILAPHDPIPSGPDPVVVVLRRLEEDEPGKTTVQIILTGAPEQVTHPHSPDGRPMPFHDAIEAAKQVAESEGLNEIFVLDRAKGRREHDILAHGGNHGVNSDALLDADGGEGTDMRDVAHPARSS